MFFGLFHISVILCHAFLLIESCQNNHPATWIFSTATKFTPTEFIALKSRPISGGTNHSGEICFIVLVQEVWVAHLARRISSFQMESKENAHSIQNQCKHTKRLAWEAVSHGARHKRQSWRFSYQKNPPHLFGHMDTVKDNYKSS